VGGSVVVVDGDVMVVDVEDGVVELVDVGVVVLVELLVELVDVGVVVVVELLVELVDVGVVVVVELLVELVDVGVVVVVELLVELVELDDDELDDEELDDEELDDEELDDEELDDEELVVDAVAVTPHVTWPMKTSPTANGPCSSSWRAVTVSEPSGFVFCSLKMNVNMSPTFGTVPLMASLTGGLAGMFTVVVSDVWSVPPVTVVEPVTPFWSAVQVLFSSLAVKISWVDVLMFMMSVELVTEPFAPSEPAVWTVIGPEEKIVAGPALTSAEVAVAS
jgi:hypothetical protein